MFVNEVKRSMVTDSNSVPEFHYGEVATDFRMPLPDQFECLGVTRALFITRAEGQLDGVERRN